MADTKATGIESDRPELEQEDEATVDRVVKTVAAGQHVRLMQVELLDVTDRHNELVHEREWLLHPSERELSLKGNLFVVDDLETGTGQIFVKAAPLPHARPIPSEQDLAVRPTKPGGFEFDLLEAKGSTDDPWTILEYAGGVVERSRVLHEWQASHRPDTISHTIPRFISNTWGDRSRDSRIRQDFLESEIDRAAAMGVDVVQIDDGWEQGVTANSSLAQEKGGVWEGFWNSDPDFWKPHPDRFPDGLQPIVDRVKKHGMNLGLWFGPDSWEDFGNWERDAETILDFYRTYGIEHIKIDGVKARTTTSLGNLQHFFKTVLDGSRGNVIFDLDVTAEIRPGYLGAMNVGPLFVENRYTDWHNYWPHQTLRNLWQLSRWIDPRRLRMEFLNNARNVEQYESDPVAPGTYDPSTLFATVMCSNPLGWFEVSSLSDEYVASVAELVARWKDVREELFAGTILPVGAAPDGRSFSGLVSLADDGRSGLGVVFRGKTPSESASLSIPGGPGSRRCDILHTNCGAHAEVVDGILRVSIRDPFGHAFIRFGR